MGNYRSVPVQLCLKIIRRDKSYWSMFKLYLYLNLHYSGKVKLTPKVIKDISRNLGVHKKTVETNIRMLQDVGWIHYGSNISSHYIHGFESVCYKTGVFKTSLKVELDLDSFQELDIWLKHVGVTYAVRCAIHSNELKRKSELRKAQRNKISSNTNFRQTPLKYFAKVLNRSTSTISSWLNELEDNTLLQINRVFEFVDKPNLKGEELFFQLKLLNKYHPGYYRSYERKIYRRSSLIISPNMKFYHSPKRGKKLDNSTKARNRDL